MLDMILAGLSEALQLANLLFVLLGVIAGMIAGAILGVNGIWLVVTVSEFITAAVAFFFIRRETH